ncbi:MAG: hypothetical protein WCJ41_15615 [Aestuariivirga sp.]|uniref:hypothetical protein n=1 Tax=Aestuariivirga sp. TaxID=2650926 RepID=UPI003015AC54
MSLLIIDGISCAGKSLLLANLQRVAQQGAVNFSKLFISEHLTERVFEGLAPTSSDVRAHTLRLLDVAYGLRSILSDSPFAERPRTLSMVIERLFLTFMSRGLLTLDFFAEHRELLHALAPRHVFLVVPEGEIERRIVDSMERRSPLWANFISSLGGAQTAAHRFATQQAAMASANAALPDTIAKLTFEISDLAFLSDPNFAEKLLWPACGSEREI